MSVDVKKTGLIVGVTVNMGLVLTGATCGVALPSPKTYIQAVRPIPLNCYSKGLEQAEPGVPYSTPNSLLSANTSLSAVGSATVYSERGSEIIGTL